MSDDIHACHETQLDRIEQRLDQVHRAIFHESEPSRGIMVRLDRIEQNDARRNWWSGAAIVAAMGAAATAVGAWIKGNGGGHP